MHVYLLPLGDNRYDLYCEMKEPTNLVNTDASRSVFARWRRDFLEMVRAAEPDQPAAEIVEPSVPLTGFSRWIRNLRSHLVRWIAASIAEQRLLWNLRRQTEVMLVYPKDLEAQTALETMRDLLQHDVSRHFRWLVIDVLALGTAGLFSIIPGPNIIAYYFSFRVIGHCLSISGARKGLFYINWRLEASQPLVNLRHALKIDSNHRREVIREIAVQLGLKRLPAFFERTAVRSS